MDWRANLLSLALLFSRFPFGFAAANETAPTICALNDDRNAVYLLMAESQLAGATISKLPVQGLTFGPLPEIELRLVDGEDLVALDARTKELKLKKAIDRDGEEGTVKFDAIVECRSLLPNDNFKVNISVFVNVQDVNDNAPVFDRPEYSFNVTEELPIDTVVFADLFATDADSDGPNSDVRYEIVDGPYSQLLKIANPSKGVLSVGRRIDFESLANFTVTVRAKDGGRPEQQSMATVRATVLDVDDLNPIFDHDSYDAVFDPDGRARMEPGPIRASDGDTLRATIAYSLSGEHSNLFAIHPTTGVLLNRGYRSPRPIVLLVHARQTDRAERQSQATVRIRLSGEGNSTDLRFTRSEYSVEVWESARTGAVIVQVVAVGGDPTEPMTYSLLDAGSVPMFALDKNSGEVTLIASLDYENRTEYRFAVQARQADHTTSAKVRIRVLNVNEHNPIFDQPSYEFFVKGAVEVIGAVQAIDNDVGDQVHYSLVSDYDELFAIDSEGHILVEHPEKMGNQTYDLRVEAEDSGDPPRRAHVSVVVHASDQPVAGLLFLASSKMMVLLIGLAVALLLLFVCCLLLACYVCRLRKKEALYAPHRAWRSRQLDKLILANPVPRRVMPSISDPQPQIRLPPSISQTLQRYQEVSIVNNNNKNKMGSDDSRSSSDPTYSPHGSSSPLHRDTPDMRRYGRDNESHATDHDRGLSISYASLSMFPPPLSPQRPLPAEPVPVTVARSGAPKTFF